MSVRYYLDAIRKLITSVSIVAIGFYGNPVTAQSTKSSTFYVITRNDEVGKSVLWSVSKLNQSKQLVYELPLKSGLLATALPADEIKMVTEDTKQESLLSDWKSRFIAQTMVGSCLLNSKSMLILKYYFFCYRVDREYCYGYREFSVLNLESKFERKVATVLLHNSTNALWQGCSPAIPISVYNVRISSSGNQFSFTIGPAIRCSGLYQQPSRTIIVSYEQEPVTNKTLEMVDGVSWSPNGDSISYLETSCKLNQCIGTIKIDQVKTGAVILVRHDNLPPDWPALTGWINEHTIIYRWFGLNGKTESGIGLQTYDLTQSDLSVYSNEDLLKSNGLYPTTQKNGVFVGETTEGKIVQISLHADTSTFLLNYLDLSLVQLQALDLPPEILTNWPGWASIFSPSEVVVYAFS